MNKILDENYLDLIEEKARQRHFKRMTEEVCVSGVAASIFVDILATLERIGDHIHNITKQTDMNYTNTISNE